MSSKKLRPAVFLDRDGTVVDELGFLSDPEQLRLLPGAAAGVRRLNLAHLPVIVVTNQSGIARGLFDERALAAIHARMHELLARDGARIDGVLHCPHHPEFGAPPLRRACSCRKPEPGLILEAARQHEIDLGSSFLIGDSGHDLEAARRAGVSGRILVATGKGRETRTELEGLELEDVRFARDLVEAAEIVLASLRTDPA